MTKRVNPELLREMKAYGAVGAEKCINCGNCTAICSLTQEDDRFPRNVIRMVQLGLNDELLGSKELWLCFNCGDCSETCPQQAEPANLVAAARGYAIAHYSPFGIGKLFYRHSLAGAVIATLMVLFFGLVLANERREMAPERLELFRFIPYELIHNAGLVMMIVIGLLAAVTVLTMIVRIARANRLDFRAFFRGSRASWFQGFWESVMVESLGQYRYRRDCEAQGKIKNWWWSKWFVHAATMWGFLGLLLATALDFALDIVGLKETGTFVPLWYPTRLIGTLSGVLFAYGVTVLLYKRWKGVDKAHSLSRHSDWIFLALLWLSGMSGFVIEIALYLPGAPEWGYWTFIFHVAVSITLLLLLPFTKFAHSLYRIVALYVHALYPQPSGVIQRAVAAAGD